MITALNTLVPQIKYNGNPFKFYYGDKGWQNMMADEQAFPAFYMITPLEYDLLTGKGPYIGESYPLDLLCLFKSELDWTPQQHQTQAIVHAKTAVRSLISRMQKSTLIDEISNVKGKEFALLRDFDVGVSGVWLTLNAKLHIEVSTCVS